MKYKLVVKGEIAHSAHYLKHYVGKCAGLHGHSYVIEACVSGDKLVNGMLIDSTYIKKYLNDIVSEIDHNLINDALKMEDATAENIAAYIFGKLSERLLPHKNIKLDWIRVHETEDMYAEVSKE